MTLLEILVRDWPVWIGGSRTYQDEDGDLIASDGYCFRHVCGQAEIATDRATAVVTERKWSTQRNAINAASQSD